MLRGNLNSNVIVDLSLDAQGSLSTWASSAGPSRLAVAAGYVVIAIVLAALRPTMQPRNRWIALTGFGVLWLAVEGAYYRFDLFVLPVVRTIADIPGRVANWSDPLRWSVLFELLAALVVAALVWFRLRRRLQRSRPSRLPESRSDSSRRRDAARTTTPIALRWRPRPTALAAPPPPPRPAGGSAFADRGC